MVRLFARFWSGESRGPSFDRCQVRQIDELRLLLCLVLAIRCSIHCYLYTAETFLNWMVEAVSVFLLCPCINVLLLQPQVHSRHIRDVLQRQYRHL